MNDEEVTVLSHLIFDVKMRIEDFSFRVSKKFNIDMLIITAGAIGYLIYKGEGLNFI